MPCRPVFARASIRPSAAGDAFSVEVSRLGSSAVGTFMTASARKLAVPMPFTPGVNHPASAPGTASAVIAAESAGQEPERQRRMSDLVLDHGTHRTVAECCSSIRSVGVYEVDLVTGVASCGQVRHHPGVVEHGVLVS